MTIDDVEKNTAETVLALIWSDPQLLDRLEHELKGRMHPPQDERQASEYYYFLQEDNNEG